jgi:pyruvate/2-oxoacid:ferredoxin oxidoreductase beta subunit
MLKKYEDICGVQEEFMMPAGRSCAGCGGGILTRIAFKALGPNTVCSSGSCGTNTTGLFPVGAMSTFPVPTSVLGGSGAALSGLREALDVQGRQDAHVLGIIGDGDAADIGHGGLSACFERGHKVIVIVSDNQGYAATGGQRSGTTEFKAWTRSTPQGKSVPPKYLPLIFLAHNIPYVATASVAYPEDLFAKVQKAANRENQPAFIQCLIPCPVDWHFATHNMVEVARLASQSGLWPLWEYERGKFDRMELDPKPVEDYFELQGRFKHLTEGDTEEVYAYIDDLDQRLNQFMTAYAA